MTSEARANFNHPVSHLGPKLTGYLMSSKRILSSCLPIMHFHGSIFLECIHKFYPLKRFLHIFQSLTVNESVNFQLVLHSIKLS